MELTQKLKIMENSNYSTEKYLQAKKQVDELKGFYGNLVSYIFVSLFFLIINLIFSPNHLWFFWPMLGWGIGVFFHALSVFNKIPFFGSDWEENKIKELMEKEKNNFNTKNKL